MLSVPLADVAKGEDGRSLLFAAIPILSAIFALFRGYSRSVAKCRRFFNQLILRLFAAIPVFSVLD